MSCRERHEVISAWVDGEATTSERAELSAHLESCATCRARMASLRSLKHGVSTLEARSRPPEAVFARVEALRFRPGRPESNRETRRLWGVGVASALVLSAVAAWGFLDRRPSPSLAEELIADHMKYVPEAMPAEVTSSEPEGVRRFFEGKVPFAPVVPSLDGAKLLGGRLCRIRGYYEQLLFYEREGRKLSLYVSNRTDAAATCNGRHGYNICGQRREGLSLMLVGDAPESALRTLLESAKL